MFSRRYIVGLVAVALLIWGPHDHDAPWGMVVRTGYLILGPLVLWFVLKWVWKQWRPDEAAEDRLERTLHGVTSGMLLAWATDRMGVGHDKVRDTYPIFFMLMFSALCFFLSVTKIQNKKD